MFRRKPKSFHMVSHYDHVLGTLLETQVRAETQAITKQAETVILAEINRLEAIFNRYSPHSELSRWDQSFQEPIPVSSELFHLLELSEDWRIRSGNAFHPSTHSLSELIQADDQEALHHWRAQSRVSPWTLNRENQTATKQTNLKTNLNSIAKGYIIDCASQAAAQVEGVTEMVVNIGGDLRHIGATSIPVQITDPTQTADNAPPIQTIELSNQAIATSGHYFRGFEHKGEWNSHIIDPRTANSTKVLLSCSIIAPDAVTADVLSTVCSILQPDQTFELIEPFEGIGVLLINQKGTMLTNTLWESLVLANE